MIEMVRRYLRQKYGSVGFSLALGILAIIETFTFANGGGRGGFVVVHWGIFLLAAGSVSRDVSSGALQMILSRPIRRTEYLFGRYLGIPVNLGRRKGRPLRRNAVLGTEAPENQISARERYDQIWRRRDFPSRREERQALAEPGLGISRYEPR